MSELATLELEFLEKVGWKIVPRPEALEDYYRSLVERTEGYELEIEEGSAGSGSGSTSLSGGSGEEDSPEKGEDGDKDEEMVDEPPT